MKKLDSSNILFIVCIGFVLMILIGLVLQSCRTVRLDSSTETTSHSVVEDKHTYIDDHVNLSELCQQWDENLHIIVRDYAISYDSSGQSKPVLQRETELMHNRTYQRDSSSFNQESKMSHNNSYNQTTSDKKEVESVDKKPLFSYPWWLILGIPILLFLCKSKKKLFFYFFLLHCTACL